MKINRHALTSALALLLLICCNPQKPEPPPALSLHGNAHGIKLLQRSLASHGDLLDSRSGSLSLTIRNPSYRHLGQSLVPLPPFESYSWDRKYFFDRSNDLEKTWSRQEYSGFVFETAHVLRKGVGKEYDINNKTQLPDNNSRLASLDILPATHLRAALKNPMTIQLLRQEKIKQDTFDIVHARGSGAMEFWIHHTTALVARVDLLATSAAYGATLRSYRFSDYLETNGVRIPATVHYTLETNVMDTVTNIFLITADSGELPIFLEEPFWDSFPPPAIGNRPGDEVATLAKGIFLHQNITSVPFGHSYNVLFAEFKDFILACEAPVDAATAENVMNTIKRTIPGKPIRYLVQSHHHNDHLAGIRSYIAAGTQIVTTPANTALITKIAEAPFVHAPDRQEQARNAPVFDLVTNKRWTLTDADMAVEVYDIGPTLHANEMLVAYFPKEGILFQSDMILYREHPHNTPLSRQLAAWIKKSGLTVNKIAGVHGFTMDKQQVADFLEEK